MTKEEEIHNRTVPRITPIEWALSSTALLCLCVYGSWLVWAHWFAGDLSWVWYLNWHPGAFSIVSFFTDGVLLTMVRVLGVAMFAIGVVAFRLNWRGLAIAILVGFCAVATDPIRIRLLSSLGGLATVECVNDGSPQCALNAMHRAYDLGERPPVAAAVWSVYAAVRADDLPRPIDAGDSEYRERFVAWSIAHRDELDRIARR